jgi:hypothetical protein
MSGRLHRPQPIRFGVTPCFIKQCGGFVFSERASYTVGFSVYHGQELQHHDSAEIKREDSNCHLKFQGGVYTSIM